MPSSNLILVFPENMGAPDWDWAISKQLVELHGGKIQAESKYSEGSTFIFSLPLKSKK
jgi:signal transduction histidine kinase